MYHLYSIPNGPASSLPSTKHRGVRNEKGDHIYVYNANPFQIQVCELVTCLERVPTHFRYGIKRL